MVVRVENKKNPLKPSFCSGKQNENELLAFIFAHWNDFAQQRSLLRRSSSAALIGSVLVKGSHSSLVPLPTRPLINFQSPRADN